MTSQFKSDDNAGAQSTTNGGEVQDADLYNVNEFSLENILRELNESTCLRSSLSLSKER